jgi:hypothetical protein
MIFSRFLYLPCIYDCLMSHSFLSQHPRPCDSQFSEELFFILFYALKNLRIIISHMNMKDLHLNT